MCWYTRENIKMQTAYRDIICYKILSKKPISGIFYTTSIFMNKKYRYNKIYKQNTGIYPIFSPTQEGITYIIKEAFHSYAYDNYLQGFHNFISIFYKEVTNSPTYHYILSNYLYKCVIPKGSTYYQNEFGEIVSNQIKITRKCIRLDKLLGKHGKLIELL